MLSHNSLQTSNTETPRVLACILCQQRKIRCDRTFPCANCHKANARCVPATQTRQRRKRFPERELLDRLRGYEALLRQNNIKFEPLHSVDGSADRSDYRSSNGDTELKDGNSGATSRDGSSLESEKVAEARSIWQALGREGAGSDRDNATPIANALESGVKAAWDDVLDGDNNLGGTGLPRSIVDLATFHPDPVSIFNLWQVYLDNVDPLLKVTHMPTLQGRIIKAISNLHNIEPALEALLFSIYAISVLSLGPEQCLETMGMSKNDLMTKYQFGAQQALINAGVLQTTNRDCLTAQYLYLLSLRPGTNPRSLSAMLGVAVRTAQRMGIHRESYLAKCTIFEAEMRRRLWWSLMIYDARMGEKADFKDCSLAPTWDCNTPLNCNDSDLWPEMKEPPIGRDSGATESIFIVIRSEFADFMRNCHWYLEFSNPALKPLARQLPENGSLLALHARLEHTYLRFCDPANKPLQFLTVWMTRSYIIRSKLFEHYASFHEANTSQTDAQRNYSLQVALDMLVTDTTLMGATPVTGYKWYLLSYFPFPAYMHIVQHLACEPLHPQAEQAWNIMYENYCMRVDGAECERSVSVMAVMFGKTILIAWEALKKAYPADTPPEPPKLVAAIQARVVELPGSGANLSLGGCIVLENEAHKAAMLSSSSIMGLPSGSALFETEGGQDDLLMGSDPILYQSLYSQSSLGFESGNFDWLLQS